MTLKLLERMTGPPPSHSRFVGEPIDLAELDPLALGDLWTVARSVPYGAHSPPSFAGATAEAIGDRGRQVGVAFRGPACRDYLDFTTRKAEAEPDKAAYGALSFPWREARFALSRCIDLTFDSLGPAAARFLAATE
jgi:hypothetical protein